jgi:hypothetical protein
MYMRSSRVLSKIFKLNSSSTIVKSISYPFGYVVGANFNEFIDIPTSRLLKDVTDKYPSNTFINSFEQNQQLTYQQALEKAE